jgi:hypothetical protein
VRQRTDPVALKTYSGFKTSKFGFLFAVITSANSHHKATTRSNTMSKKDLYIASMKKQLDELNQAMAALSDKAHEAKLDAKEKYDAELLKLQEQSRLAVAKLEELKQAGEDKWEDLTSSVETLRDAFTHSFHYFKSQLKK